MTADTRVVKRGPGHEAALKEENPSLEPTDSTGRSHAPPFLVVAVGASAGGLEAFSKLLAPIARETPLAMVLVQHLAPSHRSILPELLDKATRLNVVEAHDNQEIKPGHVYVIAPNVRMTVFDGSLHVRPATQNERQGAVDVLFQSVASEYRDRGVGVILSGSASDGSAGIREIKAAGGITLVQKPEEATVDGMPRAAITTGHVDSVLPVDGIADLLICLSRNPFFDRKEPSAAGSASDLAAMARAFQLLRRTTGIDFNKYKPATLKRRLDRRMSLQRVSVLSEYVALLNDDSAELQRLQEDLLIHVTSFFRDPPSYIALNDVVFPRLFADSGGKKLIRFWVPGCSTGEEVYSLAILAEEYLIKTGRHIDLQIFGTDVSDNVIARARTGVYASNIASDISPERLRAFFSRINGGGYRINKNIRDRCVFARQDITYDPPFSRLDLIVCRNLLIYLNQATQQKVLGVFHYALLSSGVLMLGPSESVGNHAHLFSPLAKHMQLFTKKTAPGLLDLERAAPSDEVRVDTSLRDGMQKGRGPKPRSVEKQGWDPQTEANRFLLDRFSPPAVIIDPDGFRVLRARGDTSRYLQLPDGELSVDVVKMIRPGLRPALQGALSEATKTGAPAVKTGVRYSAEQRERITDLHVVPLGNREARQFLVMFDELSEQHAQDKKKASPRPSKTASARAVHTLERELATTRDELQGIIDDLAATNEELQSANEEVLSSNEELQSTNEELETAKEELQSTNEELVTLNDELSGRNEELSVVNGDLANLLTSVQIPIVMVTRDLRLRQATEAAEKVLHIIPSDMGRPIGHLKLNLLFDDLGSLVAQVIDSAGIQEREMETKDGKTFVLQIRPYQTVDKKIDGAVLVLLDMSTIREQGVALELARGMGELLMAEVRHPVLLLDQALKVLGVNDRFCEYFAVSRAETMGAFVFDLGKGQWNIPALRNLLEEVLPQKKNFVDFEVRDTFPSIGQRTVRLDARTVESSVQKRSVILLTFRQVL